MGFLDKKIVYGPFTFNGIDRLDNSGGYVSGNIVSCCQRCNMAKGKMSAGDFIGLCMAVSAHIASRGKLL